MNKLGKPNDSPYIYRYPKTGSVVESPAVQWILLTGSAVRWILLTGSSGQWILFAGSAVKWILHAVWLSCEVDSAHCTSITGSGVQWILLTARRLRSEMDTVISTLSPNILVSTLSP